MKAQKVTLKIEVDTLDIASAKGMILQMLDNLANEAESGSLYMSDGDKVEWNTSRKDLQF